MKRTNFRNAQRQKLAGFTMVEIALSIAIVAFALVAIIGVLPTGMRVQKDNREETIINAEGNYMLEAVRAGAVGMDELTNYVESIVVSNINRRTRTEFVHFKEIGPNKLRSGRQIIELLSSPKFLTVPGLVTSSNTVTARMRAITGGAGEKSATNDLGFRYQLTSEIIPFSTIPTNLLQSFVQGREAFHLTNNLYDVRLTLRWPLYLRGNTWEPGRNKKTFRTLVSGSLSGTTNGGFLFQQLTFTNNNVALLP